MNTKSAPPFAVAVLISTAAMLRSEDAKSGAEDMKYSRDVYSKVHMVAIAKLEFEAPLRCCCAHETPFQCSTNVLQLVPLSILWIITGIATGVGAEAVSK
jgi:hypothetical protein